MKKFTFLLSLLFCLVGATTHAQVAFETSDAPTEGSWAANTKWYKMTLRGKYVSARNADAKGYLYANSNSEVFGEQAWWCIVGDEENGYKFYNKLTGTEKVLGVSDMDKDGQARAQLCDVTNTTLGTTFTLETKDGDANVFYSKDIASGVYFNERGGYVSNWTSAAAYGDAGSAFCFYEVTDQAADIAQEATQIKETLNAAITKAKGATGEELGYYAEDKIAAAEAVYNNETATPDEIRAAIAALTPNQPKTGVLYRLVSAYTQFETQQNVKKGIYANGSQMVWGNVDTTNPTQYWLFEETEGGYLLKNAATHAYAYTAAALKEEGSVVTVSWPINEAGVPIANIHTGTDAPFHAGGHGGGAGVSGSLLGYGTFGSETNGASAWSIVPATLEEVNTITGENIAATYPSSDNALQLGFYNAEEVNKYAETMNNLNTATSLEDAINAFNNLAAPTAKSFSADKYYRFVNVGTTNNLGYENTLGVKDGKAFCSAGNKENVDFVWQVLPTENGKYNLKNVNSETYLQSVQNGQTAQTALAETESPYEVRLTEAGIYKLYNSSAYPAQVETNDQNANYLNGWDGDNAKWQVFEVNEVEVPMTAINEKTYAVVYLPFAISAVEGAEVYAAKFNETQDKLDMTKVEGGIPANCGVVLVGAGEKATLVLGEATAEISENALVGTNKAIVFNDDETPSANYLVFGQYEDGVGFVAPLAEGIAANKAYMDATSLDKDAFALNFDTLATAISNAVLDNQSNAAVFDLSGRRVMAPVKGGVYIQNGQKFVK